MFTASVDYGTTVNQAVVRLRALRQALANCSDYYGWLSGLSVTDLTGLGFSSADAQTLQAAFADAHALAQIYSTGLPPSTYPQPASAYVYEASQAEVIGPQ